MTPLVSRSLLALATAALAAGCANLDADTVARVGDAELSVEEFERRADDLGFVTDGRVDGNGARATIGNWIGLQLAERSGIVETYETGPVESGVTCMYAVPAPDQATADDLVARLDAGEEWADVMADTPNLNDAAGRQQCLATARFGEAGALLAELGPDTPHLAVALPDLTYAVVRFQQVDEVNGFELLLATDEVAPGSIDSAFRELDNVDVDVDPRYGAFDPETLTVRPLSEPDPADLIVGS